MTDALGYTRLSQKSDVSIRRQKELIREYCDEHGLVLVDIYDDGQRSSGFDDDRPAYNEMTERVRAGDVNAVVVRDRTRLGRDKHLRMEHFSRMARLGVELHTVEDGYVDPKEPTALLREAMYAQQHDESKREEIKKSKAETARRIKNGYDHGRPRFGMTYDDEGKYQVPGEDFDVVLDVLQAHSAGETYREIEEELGVSRSTAQKVVDRRKWYVERSKLAK